MGGGVLLWYNLRMMETNIVERRGRIEDLDRSFAIAFWQAQSSAARFDATWELIVHAARVRGIDVRQLRLQRSVERYGKPGSIDANLLTVSIDRPQERHRSKSLSENSDNPRQTSLLGAFSDRLQTQYPALVPLNAYAPARCAQRSCATPRTADSPDRPFPTCAARLSPARGLCWPDQA